MKRLVLTGLLCSVIGLLHAEELSVEAFTLSAGQTKDIAICLTNQQQWGGFQFDIFMPEGVCVFEDEDGLYYEVSERLQYKNGRKTVDMEVQCRQLSNGAYRFIIANSAKANINGTEGEVLYLRLVASDAITTGVCHPMLKGVVLSDVNGNTLSIDDTTYDCTLQVDTKVSALGYATFSWPRALDFSGQDVEAFIATERSEGVLHLQPVTKVPAHTGILLKGAAATYHPETTESVTDDVTGNLLHATDGGAWEVTGTDVFVLSDLDNGKAGFYRVAEGLLIGQYKSYLQSASAVRSFVFEDETTGVRSVGAKASAPYYTLEGVRIGEPQRRGLYISGGKKIIVK